MIKYTRHARGQMVERGISVTEVESAIKMGSKGLQTPNKILHHFRYFTIVTKKSNNDYIVITVEIRR